MVLYPLIDPIAFSLGPIAVHWYGIMYLIGFSSAWLLGCYRAKKPHSGWTTDHVSDLIFYGALGVVLGGRLGYMLFYDFSNFIANPLLIIRVWDGGMSFHGGVLGVSLSLWLFARFKNKTLSQVADFLVPLVPLGLAAGRIGNFINGELWGRVTTMPWGMIYPNTAAGPLPRHPSVIYEFFLEGIVLFIIIWLFSAKPRPAFAVSGLFLMCYGLFRFICEFFRQPDPQLGFIAFDWLTMGQLLSLPMIIVGIALLTWSYCRIKR